jgi:hypothetical protein
MCREKKAGKPKAFVARDYDGEPVVANYVRVKAKRKRPQAKRPCYSDTDDADADSEFSCGSNPMPPPKPTKQHVRTVLQPKRHAKELFPNLLASNDEDFDMYGSIGDIATGVCEVSENLFDDPSWAIPTPKYN